MKFPLQPITLSRDVTDAGLIFWHLSDERAGTIMAFLDFIIDCVDVQSLSAKTVEGRAYSLKKWYQFLSSAQINALDADDEALIKFRDHLVKRQPVNSSGDLQARRRTINLDLRNIYAYYAWLQKQKAYCQGRRLIGTEACQITSSLSAVRTPSSFRSDRDRYPVTFRNAGERSKHRLGFVPREEHRAALTEYFYETYPLGLAKRNCLMFELAWSVGWRRGSIMSLTIDQFSQQVIFDGANSTNLLVRPLAQKFGYSNLFPVERNLAIRILTYVEQERAEIVRRTKSSSSAVFLNERCGQPLTLGAVSGIFGKARLTLGWPAGAGLHGWRRGFANAYIEREIDARIELGLDTGGESIAMSLAIALGQESLTSQAAYVRDAQRRIRGTATFRDKGEHARLADENALLREKIAGLMQTLAGK